MMNKHDEETVAEGMTQIGTRTGGFCIAAVFTLAILFWVLSSGTALFSFVKGNIDAKEAAKQEQIILNTLEHTGEGYSIITPRPTENVDKQ